MKGIFQVLSCEKMWNFGFGPGSFLLQSSEVFDDQILLFTSSPSMNSAFSFVLQFFTSISFRGSVLSTYWCKGSNMEKTAVGNFDTIRVWLTQKVRHVFGGRSFWVGVGLYRKSLFFSTQRAPHKWQHRVDNPVATWHVFVKALSHWFHVVFNKNGALNFFFLNVLAFTGQTEFWSFINDILTSFMFSRCVIEWVVVVVEEVEKMVKKVLFFSSEGDFFSSQ